MLPIVAIVGRPNVGKSTIFNRLIGKRHAIIAHEAGTTRDRIFRPCEFNELECMLVDTGGIEDPKDGGTIEDNIQRQAEIGIKDADLILFTVDGIASLTSDDFKAADILRKSDKKVLLVVNKCDTPQISEAEIANVYQLGFGDPIKISAIHKLGVDELKNTIEKTLKGLGFKKKSMKKEEILDEETIKISLLGRPNVGKSSLFNALIGKEKVIVSNIPGTTRDSIDTDLEYEGKKFKLIDTAGLRRRGKIEVGIEKFSSLRSVTALERSDLACLLIDGEEGVAAQDCHVAQHILEQEKGLIIVVNKIDLFEAGEEQRDKMVRVLRRKFSFVPWAPVLFISAQNKKNIEQIFKLAEKIKEEREKRIPTSELNNIIQQIVSKHHQTTIGRNNPKILYTSQVANNPPVFALVVNNPKNFHFSYLRYLENQLREQYGFNGTPIKLKLKTRSGRNTYKGSTNSLS